MGTSRETSSRSPGIALRSRTRVEAGGPSPPRLDAVAVEEPLEIRVDGETVAVTLRTPGQDADLALGFLFAEGIIEGREDVGSVSHCGRAGDEGYGNVVEVRSAGGIRIDVERVLEGRRWSMVSSACGVCGRRSIEGLLARCGRVASTLEVDRGAVGRAMERLASSQPVFARTGGLHAAAVVSAGGELLSVAEDVGRHNAVDKAIGSLVRRGLAGAARAPRPAKGLPEAREHGIPAILAVSGRASFEIVQKAATAGVPVVASVSAPSSLAIDLAEAVGIGLVGFARAGAFNVYASAWRIAGEQGESHPAHPAP